MKETAFEWHNPDTGHCYVDYVPHNLMDENNGYVKTPLYKHDKITAIIGHDFESIINQEVEKRIAERMPSDELIEEIQEKSLLEYENAPICEIDYYSGFEDGVKWLRSRLTNQKTEGGGE